MMVFLLIIAFEYFIICMIYLDRKKRSLRLAVSFSVIAAQAFYKMAWLNNHNLLKTELCKDTRT